MRTLTAKNIARHQLHTYQWEASMLMVLYNLRQHTEPQQVPAKESIHNAKEHMSWDKALKWAGE